MLSDLLIKQEHLLLFKEQKEKGSQTVSASSWLRKLQKIHAVAYFRPRNTLWLSNLIHCIHIHIYVYMYLRLQLFRIEIGSHIAVHCSTRALGGTNNGNEICIGDAFRNRTKKLTRLFLLLLQLLMPLLLLWLCHGKSRMCMVPVYILTA